MAAQRRVIPASCTLIDQGALKRLLSEIARDIRIVDSLVVFVRRALTITCTVLLRNLIRRPRPHEVLTATWLHNFLFDAQMIE
jgi:hypothetical protein